MPPLPCQIELPQYTVHTGRPLTDELHHVTVHPVPTVRALTSLSCFFLLLFFSSCGHFRPRCALKNVRNYLSSVLRAGETVFISFVSPVGRHLQSDTVVSKMQFTRSS